MNHMKICILINRAAALKIVVNIVCNKPRFEVSVVTDGICFAGDIQILRKYDFDAADNDITAVFLGVGIHSLWSHPVEGFAQGIPAEYFRR